MPTGSSRQNRVERELHIRPTKFEIELTRNRRARSCLRRAHANATTQFTCSSNGKTFGGKLRISWYWAVGSLYDPVCIPTVCTRMNMHMPRMDPSERVLCKHDAP